MKAWRIYGINDIRLDDVPYPEESPGCVLLRVRMFQLSVTDVQRLQGKTLIDKSQKLEWSEQNPLQRLGHEFCAEVIKLGEGVEEDFKVGDRVYYGKRSSCGKCELCAAGFKEFCKNAHVIGNVAPGCLSEFFVAPADCLVRVPDTISDSATAAMQPLWAAFEMVLAAEIEKGDTVAVFGQGVMGSNCAQISRAFGASYIIGVDIRDEVLKISQQLGVDIAINANQVDPIDVIRGKTQGVGPDVVFDCASGSPEVGLSGTKTLFQSLDTVRNGGKLVPVSLSSQMQS